MPPTRIDRILGITGLRPDLDFARDLSLALRECSRQIRTVGDDLDLAHSVPGYFYPGYSEVIAVGLSGNAFTDVNDEYRAGQESLRRLLRVSYEPIRIKKGLLADTRFASFRASRPELSERLITTLSSEGLGEVLDDLSHTIGKSPSAEVMAHSESIRGHVGDLNEVVGELDGVIAGLRRQMTRKMLTRGALIVAGLGIGTVLALGAIHLLTSKDQQSEF